MDILVSTPCTVLGVVASGKVERGGYHLPRLLHTYYSTHVRPAFSGKKQASRPGTSDQRPATRDQQGHRVTVAAQRIIEANEEENHCFLCLGRLVDFVKCQPVALRMRRQAGATFTLVDHSREPGLPDWPGSHSSLVPRQIQRTSRTKKKKISSSHDFKKGLKEEYSNQESKPTRLVSTHANIVLPPRISPKKSKCSHRTTG